MSQSEEEEDSADSACSLTGVESDASTSDAWSPKVPYSGKNGVWVTAGIIVADVVGAGILSMPRAIAQFGWALGGVVMALMLVANVHVSILMWKVRVGCKECSATHTYVGLVRGVFATAPEWQRRAAMVVTGFSQYMFIFGQLCVFLLSAGKGLGMLFHEYHICTPTWSLIAGGLLWPFAATARELGTYQSLVWANIITLCGTVLIPLSYYVLAGSDELSTSGSHWYALSPAITVAGVLSGLSAFTYGLTSQFMVAEIIAEMKDPMEFPKAYAKVSAPFQMVAFSVAGLGGYYWLGDKSAGMINENLPFNRSFQAAAGCLVVHMLITYIIKNVIFSKAVLRNTAPKYAHPHDTRARSWLAHNVVVLGVLACAWLIANVVPFFSDAVDLLGASFTPLSCWVIPILVFIRWHINCGENRAKVSAFEWGCIALELQLALVLMALGTYSSLINIREHWRTYGPPFDCHCEGIWSTCQCSAGHVGMGMCPLTPGEL